MPGCNQGLIDPVVNHVEKTNQCQSSLRSLECIKSCEE